MALEPNGEIVIGGFFNSVAGVSRNLIARLNSDGSLDTTFDPGTGASGDLGTAIDGDPDPFIFATALQSDGKILITGNFTNYNGEAIYGICRLNTNGTRDTSFDVGPGINWASWGRSLSVQTNGQIMLTGWFTSYNDQNCNRMALINPDGSVDTNFNPFFSLAASAVYDSVELSNGEYIVVGDTETNTFTQKVAELEPDGAFDTNFLGSDDDKTESVRLQHNGQILIGGYFSEVDGVPLTSIARLNPDGAVDTNFSAALDNFVWTIDVQTDGNILIGGGFTTVDGVSRNSVARLLASAASTTGTGTGTGPGTNTTGTGVTLTNDSGATLTLITSGAGGIGPKLSGKSLVVGRTYALTAVPARGYVFDGWTGDVTNSAATLRFVMTNSLALQANFIPNPYTIYTGTYEGLFYDPGAVSNATSGRLTLTLGPEGGYDAQLILAGAAHTWSGRFAPDLQASNTIAPKGPNPIQVSLRFQNDNSITGMVTGISFSSSLLAWKSVFTRLNPATNFAGFHTVLLPGSTNGAPSGDGYMSIDVGALGNVTVIGMLADGTSFSRSAILSPEGTIPFYVSYGGSEAAAFGWLNLAPTNSFSAGEIYWEKSVPGATNFATVMEASVASYVRPSAGVPAVPWTNAVLIAGLGDLAQPVRDSFALSDTDRLVFSTPNTNRFSVSFNAARGIFSGSFVDPTTGRLTGFHGAVLQNQSSGAGFFISGGQSGLVEMQNATSVPP
jgi:uncharacterized delta-60 repeat protein/uncharacterized repeat protein (TIGR02543 family)